MQFDFVNRKNIFKNLFKGGFFILSIRRVSELAATTPRAIPQKKEDTLPRSVIM